MKFTVPVLLVDDDQEFLKREQRILEVNGIEDTVTCTDSQRALSILREYQCGVAVIDLVMPGMQGAELHRKIMDECPDVAVVILSGIDDDIEIVVRCIQNGAVDFVPKPISPTRLVASIHKAFQQRKRQLTQDRIRECLLANSLEKPQHFEHIISVDHCIYTIFKYIEAIAPTPYPVLIRGETGVGKELFARAIHNASSVKGEFICVNCAGIDDHFFSDTLFGHVKGAFTGAGASRNGLIEMASQGTLFLDEIGDLSMPSQIKLLRLLQENSYYQLGGETPLQSSARTLAATSVNLEQAVAKGKFRKDLFFRLKAHTVTVPPLRERQQDIPVLLRYFLEKGARQLRKSVPSYSPRLLRFLARYNFPGNVRELEGMVQNALSLHVTGDLDCNPFIDAMDKEQVNFDWKPGDKISHQRLTFPEPLPTIQELEQALASEALKRSQGNKTLAARMLGITRKTLRNKLSQDASNP